MPTSRKRILIVYHAYFPSEFAVGPATAIRHLIGGLTEDFDIWLLTLNYDFSSRQPLFAEQHHIEKLDGLTIEYMPMGWRGLRLLADRLREDFEVVDIHSGFDRYLAIPALVLGRLGLSRAKLTLHSPHGIYMPIDMSRGSIKKRIYCALTDMLGLYQGVIHVCSSPGEVEDVDRSHWRHQRTLQIPHFIGARGETTARNRRQKNPHSLKMAFVGRVALQKNLLFAIDVVRRLPFASELHVFGASDADYMARCEAEIAAGTGRCTIVFHGHVPQQDLLSILPDHDVLFHPTQGENFGYSIIECLGMGIPVLLSDKSPWLDVGEYRAGWVVSLADPDGFASRLSAIYAMGEEWSELSQAALAYTRERFDDRKTADIRRQIYLGSAGSQH